MSCDFEVGLEILDDAGTGVALDFNDQASGYSVETIQMPEWAMREIRTSAPRVDGSFLLAWSQEDGVLQATVQCEGATWGEVTSRWEAARTIYNARTYYLVRAVIDGASQTFRAERPFRVIPAEISSESLTSKWQTYVIRWRVQPDPIVAPAEES